MFTLPEKLNPKAVVNQIPLLHHSPWSFFGAAVLIVLCTIVFHTLPKMNELDAVKKSIVKKEHEEMQLDQNIVNKQNEREITLQELDLFEEIYEPRISKVFPDHEGIGELTRFLERFSLELEKTGSITLNTISYGGSKSFKDYAALPIRLSFRANNYNFVRFMQMIKNSGSLDEKDFYEGKPVRLMQVNRISVAIPKFNGVEGNDELLYSISLDLSAFYNKPSKK